MAKVLDLPKMSSFSLGETSTISQRWRKWVKSFEYYIAASGITDKKQQRAVFLHLAGPEVQDIFETLEDTGTDLDTALMKLTAYFEPRKNIPFERHNFRETNQLQGETIKQYAIRLKHQVKFCEYDNPDDMIHDQIIEQCLSTRLRRRLLREPYLTLEKTMAIGRSFEPDVGHRAKDPRCPAEGMSCNNCGKLGHFARVCRSTSTQKDQNRKNTSQDEISKRTTGSRGEIRYVYGASFPAAGESSSEDEYAFELGATWRMPHAIVKIGDFPVDLIVDSGATSGKCT